jgi:REP element-mobilizing transposase RayT
MKQSVASQRSHMAAFPSFENQSSRTSLVVDLWFADKVKEFRLYGYSMAGDHVHLLVQPFGLNKILDFTGSMNRNMSRDIRDIIDMIQKRSRTRISAADDSNHPLTGNSETIRASIGAMETARPVLGGRNP